MEFNKGNTRRETQGNSKLKTQVGERQEEKRDWCMRGQKGITMQRKYPKISADVLHYWTIFFDCQFDYKLSAFFTSSNWTGYCVCSLQIVLPYAESRSGTILWWMKPEIPSLLSPFQSRGGTWLLKLRPIYLRSVKWRWYLWININMLCVRAFH